MKNQIPGGQLGRHSLSCWPGPVASLDHTAGALGLLLPDPQKLSVSSCPPKKRKGLAKREISFSCFYQGISVKASTGQITKQPLSISVSFTPGSHRRIHPLLSLYSLFSETSFIPGCHESSFHLYLKSQSTRINYLGWNLVTF